MQLNRKIHSKWKSQHLYMCKNTTLIYFPKLKANMSVNSVWYVNLIWKQSNARLLSQVSFPSSLSSKGRSKLWQANASWYIDMGASEIWSAYLCKLIHTDKTYMVRIGCHLVITLSSQPIIFVRCPWSGSSIFWSICYLLPISYLKLWNFSQSHSFSCFSPI